MREAYLPPLRMALLRAIEVGHPEYWAMPVQYLADHTGATAGADDMDDDIVVLEYPVPPGLPVNTHRGSSEQITRARRSRVRMLTTSASKHGLPRRNAASNAPSLMHNPYSSSISRLSRL